ncbi:MAG: hypothetical protein IJ593_00885 [Lachnospiraceae bacterium]|nr:hypothetical protein [Lachnospiraceae bacterium]
MPSYSIIGKNMSSGEISGYFIMDNNDKQMLISKDKTFELAEKGLINGFEVVTDDENNKYLYSRDIKISELPYMVKDKSYLKINSEITKDGKIIGYNCSDPDGIVKRYTTDKIWQLAKAGNIINAKVSTLNGQRYISIDRE